MIHNITKGERTDLREESPTCSKRSVENEKREKRSCLGSSVAKTGNVNEWRELINLCDHEFTAVKFNLVYNFINLLIATG